LARKERIVALASYNSLIINWVLFVFLKVFVAKEKLEIVIGAAPPPFQIFAGDFSGKVRSD